MERKRSNGRRVLTHKVSEDSLDSATSKQLRELRSRVKRLFKEFDFIRELEPTTQALVADIVQYDSRPNGSVLFRQGEQPDKLYVLISGEVFLWRAGLGTDQPLATIVEGSIDAIRQCLYIQNIVSDIGIEQSASQDEGSDESRDTSGGLESFGTHVSSLGPGLAFGQKAIMSKTTHDTTATCKGECHFLVIDKPDFDRVLQAEIEKIRISKLASIIPQLLVEFPFFQHLEPDILKEVSTIVAHEELKCNTLVFEEGDVADCCYIILSGEILIYKRVSTGLTSKSKPKNSPSDELTTRNQAMTKKCATILHQFESPDKKQTQSRPVVGIDVETVTLGSELATLGHGVVFGEVALLEDQPRSASVVCKADCNFLTIGKADFERVLAKVKGKNQRRLPVLVKPLLHEMSFFQGMKDAVLDRVPHLVHYKAEKEGAVLWFHGDLPDACYVLLSGEVGVWKETISGDPFAQPDVLGGSEELQIMCQNLAHSLVEEKSDRASESQSFPHAPIKSITPMRRKTVDNILEGLPGVGVSQNQARPTGSLGTLEAMLHPGAVFGQDALAGLGDGRRGATCRCEKNCQFLIIEKADFEQVLRAEMLNAKIQKNAPKIQRILREFPLFDDLSAEVKEVLPDIVRYISKPSGTKLFGNGDEANHCYILLSGEVTVWEDPRKKTGENRVSHKSFLPNKDGAGDQPDDDELAISQLCSLPSNDNASLGTGATQLPLVAPVSALLRERCGALAALLSDQTQEGSASKGGEDEEVEPVHIRSLGRPLASLGPGSLFGELALLKDAPRSATVTCRRKCEMLVIEKTDFDKMLKRDLKRAADEKLAFLRKHLPGMRHITDAQAGALLYRFSRFTYPRGHRFAVPGVAPDGSFNILFLGTLELDVRPLDKIGPNKLGNRRVLLRGSVFGGASQKTKQMSVSITASSVCEVLCLAPESAAQLPDVVQRSVQKMAEQTLTRRFVQQPLSSNNLAVGSFDMNTAIVASRSQNSGSLLPNHSAVRRSQSAGSVHAHSDAQSLGLRNGNSRPSSRNSSRPQSGCSSGPRMYFGSEYPFHNVFEKNAPELDFKIFSMEPGECLAAMGKRPRTRETWNARGVGRNKFSYGSGKIPDCEPATTFRPRSTTAPTAECAAGVAIDKAGFKASPATMKLIKPCIADHGTCVTTIRTPVHAPSTRM